MIDIHIANVVRRLRFADLPEHHLDQPEPEASFEDRLVHGVVNANHFVLTNDGNLAQMVTVVANETSRSL